MSFDLSVNLGHVITIGLALITIIVSWTKVGGRMDVFDMRLDAVDKTLLRVTSVLEKFQANETGIALMKQELTALQTSHAALHVTVEELRRGEGFIQSRRGNIDGEHTR